MPISAEEFWRRHPRPTLQERIGYLEQCQAVEPTQRVCKQIEDLKTLLSNSDAAQENIH